jgi:quinoprotein glucose dehydrogenase
MAIPASNPPRTLGVLLLILGVLLTAGGVWLLTRGASPYFLIVGAGLATTGFLLTRGSKAALIVYTLTLVVIIGGSFYEEGADFGKLVPRLVIPLLIGGYLAQPKIRETLT